MQMIHVRLDRKRWSKLIGDYVENPVIYEAELLEDKGKKVKVCIPTIGTLLVTRDKIVEKPQNIMKQTRESKWSSIKKFAVEVIKELKK